MRGATANFYAHTIDIRISIHTPHAGSDVAVWVDVFLHRLFQSTLPMRGATNNVLHPLCHLHYFNPHSPCGERHIGGGKIVPQKRFQSTLPMRGATFSPQPRKLLIRLFQSTLPMRGATMDCFLSSSRV